MDKITRTIRRGMKQENKEEIIRAVVDAWGQICPGYELICISLPKEDMAERKRIMEWILEIETRERKFAEAVFCDITENSEKTL